jgi:hypothetical protein
MKGVLKQCSLLSSLRNIAPRWCMPEHFSEAGASWRTKRCKGAGLSLWLDFKSERRPSFPLLLQQQHFQANFQVLEAEGGAEGEAEGEAEDLLVQAWVPTKVSPTKALAADEAAGEPEPLQLLAEGRGRARGRGKGRG